MIKVNLFDGNFAHSFNEDGFDTSSAGRKPKLIEWTRNHLEYDGATVFTDEKMFDPIVDSVKCKLKIGWCQESPAIKPAVYQYITQFEDKFDYILTFDKALITRNPDKYKLQLIASSRIKENDFKVYSKTKAVSIIASDKRFSTGHQLRHDIIRRLQGVDCWGSGYKYFTTKLDPLQDYMFSIAIMNHKIENYFTEILTDCFATGTIPVFWGCPNINNFFNADGIIQFDTIDDLYKIKLSKTLYESKLNAVMDNLDRAKKVASTDDLVAQNIIKIMENNK